MLHQDRFRLGIGKNFFSERVIKRWNRLPLEVFKRRVDVAVRNVV